GRAGARGGRRGGGRVPRKRPGDRVVPVIGARPRGPRTGGRGRRRLLWGVAAVVGVLAVAAGVAYLVLRDPARPVTVDEARERFRDGGEAAPAGGGDAPPAGVYVYATTG